MRRPLESWRFQFVETYFVDSTEVLGFMLSAEDASGVSLFHSLMGDGRTSVVLTFLRDEELVWLASERGLLSCP